LREPPGATIADSKEPFRSEIRQHLKGRTEALEDLAVEFLARGFRCATSRMPYRDLGKGETGRRLLSKTAVSEIGARLWAAYQEFCQRDLDEYQLIHLFALGIAERIRPGQKRESVPAAPSRPLGLDDPFRVGSHGLLARDGDRRGWQEGALGLASRACPCPFQESIVRRRSIRSPKEPAPAGAGGEIEGLLAFHGGRRGRCPDGRGVLPGLARRDFRVNGPRKSTPGRP
jgi:hypothetical protein